MVYFWKQKCAIETMMMPVVVEKSTFSNQQEISNTLDGMAVGPVA